MKLDLSALEKAVSQLERSLGYLNSQAARRDHGLREQFRAATIQAFEFTYELWVKMIRRQLAQIVSNAGELKSMNFKDLLRSALEAGLIKDFDAFVIYREKRNLTAHTYDSNEAEKILKGMDQFLADVKLSLSVLKKKNS